MISICSVVLDLTKKYEEIFYESIIQTTKLVSEVILIKNDAPCCFYKEWKERNIQFKEYGNSEQAGGFACGDQHGLGLNVAVEKATNETVYLCDPDLFFMSAADELFYELKKRYNLNAIGCSHHSATELAGTFFPWHGNIMMDKSDLPPMDNDFLKEDVKVPGKYLMAGAGITYRDVYPNPTGNFDTASGLWLWAHENHWKWMSFQSIDTHCYVTKFCRSNVKMCERFPMQKIIHHAVSGSIEKEVWEPYAAVYQEWKNEEQE